MMPSNWATHGRRSTRCSCERQGVAGLGLPLPLGIHSQPPSPWRSVTARVGELRDADHVDRGGKA